MRVDRLEHRFVKKMAPRDELEEGVLYIAIDFGLAVHLCACGCGQKVASPFSPAEWAMTYDGESISLCPSIGNWSFDCRSHYIITRNEIIWGKPFTDEMVARVRAGDTLAAQRYYDSVDASEPEPVAPDRAPDQPLWRRLLFWLRS